MAEYIERDEILQKISRMIEYCKKDNKVNGLTALFQVGDAVIDCKSADVVPVVHAHWIPQFVSKRGLSDFFTCSECNKSCFTSHKVKMCSNNFCPNCGARMDGDDNDVK